MNTPRSGRRSTSALRKVILLSSALLVAMLGSLGVAGSASAATSDCPSGYSCFWGDGGYRTDNVEDRLVKFYLCHNNLALSNWSGTSTNSDNKATSVSNKGNVDSARYYVDANYAGPNFSLAKGTGDGALNDGSGNAPSGFNDNLSSGKFASAPTGCV